MNRPAFLITVLALAIGAGGGYWWAARQTPHTDAPGRTPHSPRRSAMCCSTATP